MIVIRADQFEQERTSPKVRWWMQSEFSMRIISIVKPSDNGCEITHLGPDLMESIGPEYQDLPLAAFLDLDRLSESFERAENFCTKVLWRLSKAHLWLYCIPNFCPDLDRWLCFMING